MICYACLAFNATKQPHEDRMGFLCDKCGSWYTYGNKAALQIDRPSSQAYRVNDRTALTNQSFKEAMKDQQPEDSQMTLESCDEPALINVMTLQGEKIFMERHGWHYLWEHQEGNKFIRTYTYGKE